MSRRSRRLILLYVGFVLTLAAIGAFNQGVYREHWRLLNVKQQKQLELSELRAEVAHITGPLAVREWALARGMVATLDGDNEAQQVGALMPPAAEAAGGGLEIRTRWR